MTTVAARLTSDGILFTNSYFDEITKSWVSIAPEAIYAALFDEIFLSAGSLMFSGAADFLYGIGSVFNIGSPGTAWTFETWVYPEAPGAIFSIGNGSANGMSLAVDWGYTAANKFTVRQGDGAGYPISITTAATFSSNVWYHVAVSCTATGLRTIYINGVDSGSYLLTTAMSSADQWVINGFYNNNGLGNNGGTCHLSNLRFIVGTALYVSNFVPPYSSLVSVANTALLLCMPNNGGAFTDIGPNGFKIQIQGNPQATVLKPFVVNTMQRQQSTGTLQVGGYFDEHTGII
jgi:hypothetical protein